MEKKEKDIRFYAKVHSVESFGTVDGPGIRFVLFMQGCHLECKYCHNRDTWDINSGHYQSLDEIFNKIMNYKNYIYPRGGVTISGGEPLLQHQFIYELFTKLKKENIHTKKLIDITDLFLLDIKHIDDNKCKELVGKSNKLELEFAKYLSDNKKPMWIRQVLVPGFTDEKQDLLKLKDFINSLKTVERVELLPYHNVGEFKWKKLGLTYPLEGIRQADNNDIKRAKEILGIE